MPFAADGEIRYYQFHTFSRPEVFHGALTRVGGFSPSPWASLNMGGLVGDNPIRVERNRVLAFEAFGIDPKSMYDVWQVHGTNVVCADLPRPASTPHIKADAVLTDKPGVTLFMRFADCVPIFLYDPVKHIVGLVHSGWRGTIKKVAAVAIHTMVSNFGSIPGDILAGFGPSICIDHYEIGLDVVHQVRGVFGSLGNQFLFKKNRTFKLDLGTANEYILRQGGIQHIENPGICTACDLENWFSHRGENGKTGRFGVLIGLK
jgi:YfiH family protein